MTDIIAGLWKPERARAWQQERGWRVGANFMPSTASNQIEMWREATFDLATIERELDMAAGLGLTSMRVFLHDLVWHEDAPGLLERIDAYLAASAGRGIGTLLVLFDGVWNPLPKLGPQPEPRPRVHNSGWVQSPGAEVLADPERQDALEPYVKGVIERFRDDARIDGWDLFNEPDNPNPAYAATEISDKAERALELLRKTVRWTRETGPSQPLTVGVYKGVWDEADAGDEYSACTRFSLENSDVISYHWYWALDEMARRVAGLARFERPIMCTEFLMRPTGNGFDPHLGWMRDEEIGAYCWGFVQGRIQTEYSWDSWVKTYEAEPELWFHDVLRADGTPFDPAEADYIRSLTR